MKPFIIDRQSWHCRLVMKMTLWGQIGSRNDLNLCVYSRALVSSIFAAVVLSILAAVVTISIASMCVVLPIYAGVVLMLAMPVNEYVYVGLRVALLEAFFASVYIAFRGASWLTEHLCSRKPRVKKQAEPGLLTTALSNFHTKTCARVEISNYHDDFR